MSRRDLRARAATRAAENRQARLSVPTPRQRLDPAALLVAVAVVLMLGGVGYAVRSIEATRGFLDPPLLEEVPDHRALADYRDSTAPFVDGVRIGQGIVLGRADGTIVDYDSRTELFSDDRVPRDGRLTSGLRLLSNGCAALDPEAAEPCQDRMFAITEAGGLAQRQGARWEVLLSDAAWIAADGSPVEAADIRAWAATDDGRFVAALAGAKGIGVFDQTDGSWTTLGQSDPAAAPDRIVGLKDGFLIGGPAGLDRLTPGRALERSAVAGITGQVLDLDRDLRGGALAIWRGPCRDAGGDGCLAIGNVRASGAVTVLVGETALHAGLSDVSLWHAAVQGGAIVVLGQSGVHRYDPAMRNWTELSGTPVDALFAGTDGTPILFAAGMQFGRVEGGRLVATVELPVRMRQILPDGATVLGLGQDGVIYRLAPGTVQALTARDPGTPENTRFVTAAAMGDIVVWAGPQGMLLHDVRQRRYAFLPASHFPPDALTEGTRLLGGTRAFWLADEPRGSLRLVELSGEWPAKTATVGPVIRVPAPMTNLHASEDRLEGIAAGGRPFLVYADRPGLYSPTGEPLDQRIALQSVAADPGGLTFSDGKWLLRYDRENRGWSATDFGFPSPVIDLGAANGLTALTEDGRLWRPGDTLGAPIMGDAPLPDLGSTEITDALVAGQTLFVGGAGAVAGYNPAQRRFVFARRMGSGEVRLVSDRGLPAWVWNNALFRNGTQVSPPGRRILGAWAGPDGIVALAEQDGRLVGWRPDGDRCLFAGAPAPEGAVQDAAEVGGGRLAVVTDRGLGLLDPANRRWIATDAPAGPDRRLELLGQWLVMTDPAGFQAMPLADLPQPESCDGSRQALVWAQQQKARQLALDAGRGGLFGLEDDGAVWRWSAGTQSPLLPALLPAPVSAGLVRAYPGTGGLRALAPNGLWRYDILTRRWSGKRFIDAPASVAEIDLRDPDTPDGGALVTIWGTDGRVFGGQETGDAVSFQPLALKPQLRTDLDPATIRDIARTGDQVAILGDDALEFRPLGDPAVAGLLSLPAATAPRRLMRLGGRSALVTGADGAVDSIDALVAPPPPGRRETLAHTAWHYAPGSDRGWTLAVEAGSEDRLWRVDAEGRLWRCAMAPGRDLARACTLSVAAPLRIASPDILAAIELADGGHAILAPAGLIRLDAHLRETGRRELRDPASARLVASGASRLLWDGIGRLFRLDPDGEVLLTADARALRRRDGGLVVDLPEGLRLLREGILDDPGAGAGLTALSLQGDGRLLGRDADGFVAEAGAGRLPGAMQIAPDTQSLFIGTWTMSGQDVRNALLVQSRDGTLQFRVMASCPRLEWRGWDNLRDVLDFTPCEVALPVAGGLPDRLLAVEKDPAGLKLITASQVHFVNTATLTLSPPEPGADLLPIDAGQTAVRDRIRGFVVGEAVPELAPPRIENSGQQVSVAGRTLESGGSNRLLPSDPLQMPGLAWRRGERSLRFGDDPANTVPVAQAFLNGRLISDQPFRAAYLGGDRFAVLNAFGLWTSAGGVVTPRRLAPMPAAIGLAHGRFLLAKDGIDAASGAQTADTGQVSLTLGALTVTEILRGGTLAASYDVDGHAVPAFAAAGFLFDQRLGLAQERGTPWLLTPLGLVRVDQLAPARAVPPGTVALATDDSRIVARSGDGGWHLHDGTGWTVTAPPGNAELLAEHAGRRWMRNAGRVEIVPLVAGEAWQVARSGLDFDQDQLRGLAADGDTVVAVLGTGTQDAGSFDALAQAAAPLATPPGIQRLEAMTVRPGRSVLWAERAGGPVVWDRAARQWQAPGADRPWENRLAAALDGLEVAFANRVPTASLAVTAPSGVAARIGFAWRRNERMPFDIARTLHAEGDYLLVGTDLGLRRLVVRGPAVLNAGIFVHDPGADTAVLVSGRPVASPDRLVAGFRGGGCLEFPAIAASPVRCTGPVASDPLAVWDDRFWAWEKSSRGISGRYHLADGSDLPISLPLAGTFPHDRLRDWMDCGSTFELWDSAPIVASGGGANLRLDRVAGAGSLHCQPQRALLDAGGDLPAGPYLLTETGAARPDATTGWQPVPGAQAAALADWRQGRLVWASAALRMGIEAGRPLAEHLWRDRQWRRLNWEAGRLEIDDPRGLARSDTGVEMLTPAGFAPLAQGARAGGIDPDRLRLATPADPRALATCTAPMIETRDGSVQALAALPGHPVALRCGDGRLWSADLTGPRDIGAVTAMAEDPFAERLLVPETGGWTIRRLGSTPAAQGHLGFVFRGEPLPLSSGRFAIDDYRELARPHDEALDLVTGNGWWRQAGGRMALKEAARPNAPFDAAEVTGLGSDIDGDGAPLLCATIGDAAQARTEAGRWRSVARCADYAGRDATWIWRNSSEGPQASGTMANGGEATRKLEAGRFTDLVVTGAPALMGDGGVMVPTKAGAVRLGALGVTATYGAAQPGAVVRSSGPGAVLLGGGGKVSLTGDPDLTCAALDDLVGRLSPDDRLERIELNPDAAARVWLTGPDGRRQWLIPCDDLARTQSWVERLQVGARPRYLALTAGGASGTGELTFWHDAGAIWLSGGRGAGLRLAPAGPRVLAVLTAADGRAGYVLTADRFQRLDTDRAISDLARQTLVAAHPNGPFVEPEPKPEPEPAARPSGGSATPAPGSTTAADLPPKQPRRPDPKRAAPPPVPTPPPADFSQLVAGLTPGQIEALEGALAQLGYLKEKPDATFAKASSVALRLWRLAHRRPQDIAVTSDELAVILSQASAAAAPAARPTDDPLRGYPPDRVKEVQRYLSTLGYYTGAIDGLFGPQSRAALLGWQRKRGVAVDRPLSDADFLMLRSEARGG